MCEVLGISYSTSCNILCVLKYLNKKNYLVRLKHLSGITTGDNLVVLMDFLFHFP